MSNLTSFDPAKIRNISLAIARAEGFNWSSADPSNDNLPTRLANPGDLMDPATGQLIMYSDPEAGLQDLDAKILNIVSGGSKVYSPTMTIAELAKVYTGEAGFMNWANSVAESLHLTVNNTLLDYLR